MKYKSYSIILKPNLFNFLGKPYTHTAQAIYPNILVPKIIYDQIQKNKINTQTEALLEHEIVHLSRQKELGVLEWFTKYIISPKFRYTEELIAIKESVKIYKKNNEKFNINLHARHMSSYLYLWCVPYDKALADLEQLNSSNC